MYAHRLMYEHYVGPIPAALQIDHLCRNRACCNPDHLEAVTQQENIARATYPGGERCHLHKATAQQVMEMREMAARGVTQQVIANQYGLSRSTVSSIVNRKTWRSVA